MENDNLIPISDSPVQMKKKNAKKEITATKISWISAVSKMNYFPGSVKKMLRWACQQTGARLQEVEVKFPITNNQQVIVEY